MDDEATALRHRDRQVSWQRVNPIAALVGVFVLAYLARLLPVLRGGGLHFYGRYDDGVYYTASEALTFGHLPYRDFVMLHPPGSTVALIPFTLLGRLTSDPTGMTVARLAFMALGSLSAVLVAVLAGRWGRTRGVVGGLVYAASAAAVYSEESTFLEPLGTFLTLVALLLLTGNAARRPPRYEMLAGVALGLACSVKIWYVAILGAVALVLLVRRELGSALRLAVAGVTAAAVVVVPFFLVAPRQTWTMVVDDQLGRVGSPLPRVDRVSSIVGTKTILDGASPVVVHLVTLFVTVVIVAALVRCLADRRAWVIIGAFVTCAVVLLASPSYFRHYGVLLAAPIALVLAIGGGETVARVRREPLRIMMSAAAILAVVVSGVAVALAPTGKPFPSAPFAAAAPAGCIAADDPAALIQMNRLSTDLRAGCTVPVDVTGSSYGTATARSENTAFRTWLVNHLSHSAGFVVLRPRNDQLSLDERRRLHAYPVLASALGVRLREGDAA